MWKRPNPLKHWHEKRRSHTFTFTVQKLSQNNPDRCAAALRWWQLEPESAVLNRRWSRSVESPPTHLLDPIVSRAHPHIMFHLIKHSIVHLIKTELIRKINGSGASCCLRRSNEHDAAAPWDCCRCQPGGRQPSNTSVGFGVIRNVGEGMCVCVCGYVFNPAVD